MKACPKCGKRFLGNEEFCPNDGTTLADIDHPLEDPLIGTTVDGRYSIEKKLGEGGMGVVYLATHAVIGKKCAVKVLRGELSSESEVAARFTQEARAAAAIGNEHIIEINDFGQLPDGSAYFVMEFLDGISLHDLLNNGQKIETNRALSILAQCCEALSAAHAADIIHRDLKPENIFLIRRSNNPDFVKILDFGIAKVARESGRLTRTGVIFGTPQYMSPEQAAGTEIDARTDVYSLGIIMYEMLTGRVPFEADTFMGVLTKHLYEDPIPPLKLDPPVSISQNIQSVLLKAIAKKPNKRYQLMSDFEQDIQTLLSGKTPKIAFEAMRSTSASTLPPPSPTEIVTGKAKYDRGDDDYIQPAFSGSKKIIAAAAVCIIGIIVIVVLVFGGGGSEQTNSNTLPASGKNPDAVSAVPTVAVANSKQAKQPQIVTITSMPKGADLYKGDVLLGKVPQKVLRPESGEASTKYHLLLDGYVKKQFLVNVSTPTTLEVMLQALPSSEKKEKAPEPAQKSSAGQATPKEVKKELSASSEPPPPKTGPKKKKPKRKKDRFAGDIADPWAQ